MMIVLCGVSDVRRNRREDPLILRSLRDHPIAALICLNSRPRRPCGAMAHGHAAGADLIAPLI